MRSKAPNPVTITLDFVEWVAILTMLRDEFGGEHQSPVGKLHDQVHNTQRDGKLLP